MIEGYAFPHLSFGLFENYFQAVPQKAQRESYLKERVLCWETSFH